jgi:hypothetical protein
MMSAAGGSAEPASSCVWNASSTSGVGLTLKCPQTAMYLVLSSSSESPRREGLLRRRVGLCLGGRSTCPSGSTILTRLSGGRPFSISNRLRSTQKIGWTAPDTGTVRGREKRCGRERNGKVATICRISTPPVCHGMQPQLHDRTARMPSMSKHHHRSRTAISHDWSFFLHVESFF